MNVFGRSYLEIVVIWDSISYQCEQQAFSRSGLSLHHYSLSQTCPITQMSQEWQNPRFSRCRDATVAPANNRFSSSHYTLHNVLIVVGMWIDVPQAALDLLQNKNFFPAEVSFSGLLHLASLNLSWQTPGNTFCSTRGLESICVVTRYSDRM